jgi:hypothetical protein
MSLEVAVTKFTTQEIQTVVPERLCNQALISRALTVKHDRYWLNGTHNAI